MYEAIKVAFPTGDDWRKHLNGTRLGKAEAVYETRGGSDSDVELLLCTEFCDKRTILKKCLRFDPKARESRALPMSKRKFQSVVEGIEDLRNPLAHASTYAMKWDDVENLRQTVNTLVEVRDHIKQLAVPVR